MTDKELLFKDLCARLPYGVKVQVYYEEMSGSGYFDETVWVVDNDEPFHVNDRWIENIKPYLRPMSSMTEEERKEYKHLVAFSGNSYGAADLVDWLNKKMFAYRAINGKDMFELELALEAPEGMYK